jgi:hypothetical protein
MNEKTESLTPLDRFPEVAGALTAIYLKLKESGLLIPGIPQLCISTYRGAPVVGVTVQIVAPLKPLPEFKAGERVWTNDAHFSDLESNS